MTHLSPLLDCEFLQSIEMEFHHVGQASLELLTASDLPTSVSHSAGITGVSHHSWPHLLILTGTDKSWFSNLSGFSLVLLKSCFLKVGSYGLFLK
uniref:Uncharacterized protein n=1 Tax=Theropithecus gelada TaxID=9565 RepID=A0A8D2G4M0_THEGE